MKVIASYSSTKVATLLLAILVPALTSGQGPQGSGSPYSAFGFGDLSGAAQITQALMGGTGVALADPYSVSRVNPASYPHLVHTVFETGLVVRNLRFETSAVESTGRNTRYQGLTLGIPFGRGKWGLAMGLQPTSNVGYTLNEAVTVEGGTTTFQYTGTGGLNRAFFGLGRVIWQRSDSLSRGGRLSVGANFDYLFGTIDNTRKAYYPAGSGYYNSTITSSLVVRSPMGTVGIQYVDDLIGVERAQARMRARIERLQARDRHLENEWLNSGKEPADRKPVRLPKRTPGPLRFRIGLSMELPASLKARNTSVAHNFSLSSTGVEFPRDTAFLIDGAQGRLELPPEIGFGFALFNKHWMVTADLRRRDWSKSEVNVEGYDQRSTLVAGTSYTIGASFRPAGEEGGSFVERTIYRAGVRYMDDYISVKGTPLTQAGVSFGVALPLMGSRTRSRLNLGAEIGQRGTTSDGLLLERYTNIMVGVSITPEFTEPWFRKRRIE
ncbi:MAG: hypothetical protein IPI81_09005 [Flavobacteriales bacterium]|nr:hypothetical protein [Flavobacteriales bacterium]MCC6939005.1 hypothetical protein [Flavobacteriales bacterium]